MAISATRVYRLLLQIPAGRVTTYGNLARAAGDHRAARAVGRILSANPHRVSVPCHRVVRADSYVGGYAAGQKRKIGLLKSEGIPVRAGRIPEFGKFFWSFQ